MQKYKVYINNTIKIVNEDWESFCSNYQVINAAGGIVFNSKKQLLMIFRNGKWDLPKGKVEGDENIKSCAIREVEEETGVSKLEIQGDLFKTYHIYFVDNQEVLKRTYWFVMNTISETELKPQLEEGITKVCWIDLLDIDKITHNSFRSIIDLLKEILD